MKLPSSAFAKAMAGQVAKATTDKTAGGIIPKNAQKYTWQDQKWTIADSSQRIEVSK